MLIIPSNELHLTVRGNTAVAGAWACSFCRTLWQRWQWFICSHSWFPYSVAGLRNL